MSPDVDFSTEAASPPIEISKLDQALDDICDELTNSLSADGQTNPTANIKLNGFKLVNVGAPTVLTDAVTATTLIDQELTYYVDSGSANTYAITPSPAIAAYEEGQRFIFRAANASTTASTLNVNGLGAIAIQTADGSALIANSILVGGIYEVTYDANTTPDRWVLTSPSSRLPDGMLSSNVPLKNTSNTFTAAQTLSTASGALYTITDTTTPTTIFFGANDTEGLFGTSTNHGVDFYSNNTLRFTIGSGGNYDFKAGTVTTANASASEVGKLGAPVSGKTADHTIVAADSGNVIRCTSAADDITVQASGAPAAGCVVGILNKTGGSIDIIQGSGMTLTLAGVAATTGSRTLADGGMAYVYFDTSSTATVGGAGVA